MNKRIIKKWHIMLIIALVVVLTISAVGLATLYGKVVVKKDGGRGDLAREQQLQYSTQSSVVANGTTHEFDVDADDYYEQLQAAGIDPQIRPQDSSIPSDARLRATTENDLIIYSNSGDYAGDKIPGGWAQNAIRLEGHNEGEIVIGRALSTWTAWDWQTNFNYRFVVRYQVRTWTTGALLWKKDHTESVLFSPRIQDYVDGSSANIASVDRVTFYADMQAGNAKKQSYIGVTTLNADKDVVYQPSWTDSVSGEGTYASIGFSITVEFTIRVWSNPAIYRHEVSSGTHYADFPVTL